MVVNRNLSSSPKNYVGLADIEESNDEIVSCKEQVDILKRRLIEANNDIQLQVCYCLLVLLFASLYVHFSFYFHLPVPENLMFRHFAEDKMPSLRRLTSTTGSKLCRPLEDCV